MIHDYFSLLAFLSLGIILLSSSSFLKISIPLDSAIKESNETLRLRRKARLWRKIAYLVIIVLLISRGIVMTLGASEVLNIGYISSNYISYIMISVFICSLWIMAIYLHKIQQYFKPELIEKFYKKYAVFLLTLALIDLGVSGYFFISGYTGLFSSHSMILSTYEYDNPATFIPMLIIIGIFSVVAIVFYLLFLLKRSLNFLNQYLISLLLLLGMTSVVLFSGSLGIIGWNESLETRAQVLSWHYWYMGWIYILFFAISLFSGLLIFLLKLLRGYFLESERLRFLLLPMLKYGFIACIAFTLLTVLPILLNLL